MSWQMERLSSLKNAASLLFDADTVMNICYSIEEFYVNSFNDLPEIRLTDLAAKI